MMLDNDVEAEYWGLKAYKFRPLRMESLYTLVKFFRIKEKYHKAWEYYKMSRAVEYPKSDMLFIDGFAYDLGLDVFQIFIQKYITKTENNSALQACYRILDKSITKYQETTQMALVGIQDYVDKLSTSDVENISTSHNTSNVMRKNGLTIISNSNFKTLQNNTRFLEPDTDLGIINTINDFHLKHLDQYILYSLFTVDKELRYIANFGTDYVIGSVFRDTIHKTLKLEEKYHVLVHLDNNLFVKSWYPLTIQDTTKQELMTLAGGVSLPRFFDFCGSNCSAVKYNDKFWFVVYFSLVVEDKAVVYHAFIALDNEYKPYGYSLPFYFKEHGVEHCTSFDIKKNKAEFIVCNMGNNSKVLTTPMSELENLIIKL